MTAVLSMVKWLTSVAMPISGAAKRCWTSRDRKAEFLVTLYQEVCDVFCVAVVSHILFTINFIVNGIVGKQTEI